MKKTLAFFIFSFIVISLNAQDKFIDPRDGNSYRTMNVGGKTWMTENLKYQLPGAGAISFDNNPNNIQNYGILYDWKTAMKSCPDGWRLPTGEEFSSIINISEGDEFWTGKNSGPNSFSIQLAGMQDYEGTFTEMDESAYFWTATEYDANEAEFFVYMVTNGKPIIDISRKQDMPDIHGAEKNNQYSVRCVKNN